MNATLVLGGPGAGKTERLLRVMEDVIAAGVMPNEIAFVTFTIAAAEEARARAMAKFSLTPDQLPWLRTLHSLCFRSLGLRPSEVINHNLIREFGEVVGEKLEVDDDPGPVVSGSHLMFLEQYARTSYMGLEEAWNEHGAAVDWFRLQRFTQSYGAFKDDVGIIDFTDMLEKYLVEGSPVPVRVAIVDEGQDLTPLQWKVVDKAFAAVEDLWVAGDDDQAIHKWAGAKADHLLNLPYRREVLPVSHRLPEAVFRAAQVVITRVGRRYDKPGEPNQRQGSVQWVYREAELDLTMGDWLCLARASYLLKRFVFVARQQGVIYTYQGKSSVDPSFVRVIQSYEALRAGKPIQGDLAMEVMHMLGREVAINGDTLYGPGDLPGSYDEIWHDALVGIPLDDREYYLSCLRQGEKLTQKPRVRIETMHSSKGKEAQNVAIMTDLTARIMRGMELDPDSEHRVFYTGMTRSRENLYLVAPTSIYAYRL